MSFSFSVLTDSDEWRCSLQPWHRSHLTLCGRFQKVFAYQSLSGRRYLNITARTQGRLPGSHKHTVNLCQLEKDLCDHRKIGAAIMDRKMHYKFFFFFFNLLDNSHFYWSGFHPVCQCTGGIYSLHCSQLQVTAIRKESSNLALQRGHLIVEWEHPGYRSWTALGYAHCSGVILLKTLMIVLHFSLVTGTGRLHHVFRGVCRMSCTKLLPKWVEI